MTDSDVHKEVDAARRALHAAETRATNRFQQAENDAFSFFHDADDVGRAARGNAIIRARREYDNAIEVARQKYAVRLQDIRERAGTWEDLVPRRNTGRIEWQSPQGRRWVEHREHDRVYIGTENQAGFQILPEHELADEMRRDEADAASRARARAGEALAREADAARLAIKRGLHGFTSGMPAVKARKIEEALDKQQGFSGRYMKRREFIEEAIAGGAQVVEHHGHGEFATVHKRLMLPSGSFYLESDVTKTGMDYAEFLQGL